MDSSKTLNYFFRRYSFFRWICAILVISTILFFFFFINHRKKVVPEIYSVVPPVGSPGDTIVINGKGFGDVRDMNYVEIAGSKLTASSYISWTDECIKIVLPASVQDGLVVVGTANGRSKSALFANEVDIPVPVTRVQVSAKPTIISLSSEKLYVGDILTIKGTNFGDVKHDSKVLFSVDYSGKLETASYKSPSMLEEFMIGASEETFDYVSWTNSEIMVHIPDGVCSGVVIVQVGNEKSEAKQITILKDAGTKKYTEKKLYLVEYSADIDDVVSSDSSTITLRCPIPSVSVLQPQTQVTEVSPEPVLMNYQNDMIHQLLKVKTGSPKSVFKQSFVIDVYGVTTNVNAGKIGTYKETNPNLLSIAARSDPLVKSDNEKIIALCNSIIGIEKNYYRRANLIYNYIIQNYTILQNLRKSDADPLEMLESGEGDAYDFAIIYTALLRAAGIPALTDSGILISQDLSSQTHWWTEFYIEKVGWIPCDIAIAAGLNYKNWGNDADEDSKVFYFGNLDSHHITFSRGWNQLKPFAADNKIVQQPRSYALQSIWEEASESIVKYSSYWSVPVVKGVY